MQNKLIDGSAKIFSSKFLRPFRIVIKHISKFQSEKAA